MLAKLNALNRSQRKEEAAMTYEINELLEVGDAGATIQACKACTLVDEVSGVIGPEEVDLEDEINQETVSD